MSLNLIQHKVKRKKIRPGRGIASGKGKTCGRGHKGQKSRSGVSIKSFEGGQMPLYRRLPKRGFYNVSKKNIAVLNLNQLQKYFSKKRLNKENVINIAELKKKKIFKKSVKEFKLLGTGEVEGKINIEATYISKSAKEKIEKSGGSIKLTVK